MVRIKYNAELLKLMSMFENRTGVKIKDCFFDNFKRLWFVVNEGDVGRAVGRNGSKARRLEQLLKQRLRIFEFTPDLKAFVQGLIYPLKAEEIIINGDIVTIKGADTKTKGLLIGRNAQNLGNYESIIKRYFPVEKVRVA